MQREQRSRKQNIELCIFPLISKTKHHSNDMILPDKAAIQTEDQFPSAQVTLGLLVSHIYDACPFIRHKHETFVFIIYMHKTSTKIQPKQASLALQVDQPE